MSSSIREGMPLTGSAVERTPLRSLQHEMLTPPTPGSKHNTKSTFNRDIVKVTKGDQDQQSHTRSSKAQRTSTCGLGDITLKSFICAGGEIEISDPSMVAEDGVVLPVHQTISNIYTTEDTILSESMILQSCDTHTEHPYCNPEPVDATVNNNPVSDISHTSGLLGRNKCNMQEFILSQNTCCGELDVTFKPFICEGGEIEVSDISRLPEDILPLPNSEVVDQIPCSDTSQSILHVGDCGHPRGENAEHPYCRRESGVASSVSQNHLFSDGLNDITLKSFVCNGVEVEIPVEAELADETVPLPAKQLANSIVANEHSISQSILADDNELQVPNHSSDHPYCKLEHHVSYPDVSGVLEEALPKDQAVICHHLCDDALTEHTQDEHPACDQEEHPAVVVYGTPMVNDPKSVNDADLNDPIQDILKVDMSYAVDNTVPPLLQGIKSSCADELGASEPLSVHVEHPQCNSAIHSGSGVLESSSAKDSAFGSSANVPNLFNSVDKQHADNLSDVLTQLPEFPALSNAMQFELLSPVVKGTPLARIHTPRNSALARFLANEFTMEGETNLVAPFNQDPTGHFTGLLESPMLRPLFNSTALGNLAQPTPVRLPAADVCEKPSAVPTCQQHNNVVDIPLIPDGPLQQQLRKMAEFLMLASGRIDTAATSQAPARTIDTGTNPSTSPAERHSICVGTTPMKLVDRSLNTSGQFEKKRLFSVADNSTITEPLLWNLQPGSLECLPRQELEQRLRSSMIMVEALVQQLDAARLHISPAAGPTPSQLRDKIVQTEHTELSQTTTYRDLYVIALDRIQELEQDEKSLQTVLQCMQETRGTMTTLSSDTDTALSNLELIGNTVREDHHSLVTQYGHMKSLYDKCKDMLSRMSQKVKLTLQEREDMRQQMKESITAKEAAFSVVYQLRTHCALQMSNMEESVGSHQELMGALSKVYPEQVALNKAYVESIDKASDLLHKTMMEHASLTEELCIARGLLQKTVPMLSKLNEKAATALRERDQHLAARDQALEENEQMQEELNQANMDHQNARQQIGDLNLQVTILTSEMGVLRQKLDEREQERAQLDRQVTELSATVSSTLASYTFLEQALKAESTKLQESWKDIREANARVEELEASLGQSQQCVCELEQALAHSEEQLSQLQALTHTQSLQILQLQEVCTQLQSTKEMNEFLQMENELAREQVVESESTLRANLQGLRERNIQCEDLKGALSQLQREKEMLQEELEATRATANATQLNLEEQLAQAVTDITLVHHTLRGLTNDIQAAINDKKPELSMEKGLQLSLKTEKRQPYSSFVGSIMVALTTEKGEDLETETPAGQDLPEPQCEGLLSKQSAFKRIGPFTPKQSGLEEEQGQEEEQVPVQVQLAGLNNIVPELASAVNMARQLNEARIEELNGAICGLQGELQASANAHRDEVWELKDQLSRLTRQVERGNLAVQQKTQMEETLEKLVTEVNETQELLNKHKTDNNELRKRVAKLQRSLQQSQVESQALRDELKNTSATPTHAIDEKILLLNEMEKLKERLHEVEQGRAKLLERAKRHQMIHQTNQEKIENELRVLDRMIDTVRKTLMSIPEVVENSEKLKQLVEYLG